MKPLISLVIPVYNVEKYLPKCMETVLAQTYENYEVILVDDGSTDGSGKMCDDYAVKDLRVRVYHKQNGGLSDARNFGIQRTEGELISFIDSDDYVTVDYLERLWKSMETAKADLSVVNTVVVWENQYAQSLNERKTDNLVVLDTEKAIESMFYGISFGVSSCAKLFQTKMVRNCLFPKGELYEDLMTTYKIVAMCRKVVYDATPCYYYVQRLGSIRHNNCLDDRHWDALEKMYKIIEQFNHINPAIAKAARSRYISLSLEYMNLLRGKKEKDKMDFKEIVSKMKRISGGVLFDPSVSKNLKIKYFAVCMGYHPMCFLWKAIDQIRGRKLLE